MIQQKNYRVTDFIKQLPMKWVTEKQLYDDGYLNKDNFFNMNNRRDYYEALDCIRSFKGVPYFVFAAEKSNMGKTTYLEQLIPKLKEEGLKVGVIKHDSHDFEIDIEGKDSYRLSKALADIVTIGSNKEQVIKNHGLKNNTLEMLLKTMKDMDIILIEGFKNERIPKIHIHRKDNGIIFKKPLIGSIAIVTDDEIESELPIFTFGDKKGLISFLKSFTNG